MHWPVKGITADQTARVKFQVEAQVYLLPLHPLKLCSLTCAQWNGSE